MISIFFLIFLVAIWVSYRLNYFDMNALELIIISL